MNPKYIVNLCTDVERNCTECPYKKDITLCKVVVNAIHALRHPEFHAQVVQVTRADVLSPDKPEVKFGEPTILL